MSNRWFTVIFIVILFVIVLSCVEQKYVYERTSRQRDLNAITNYVASLTNVQGNLIIDIQRVDPQTVYVYTKAKVGDGGDLLTLHRRENGWMLSDKGVWLR